MYRESLENPKCPYCHGISQKMGKLRTRTKLLKRYRCLNCGRTFTCILAIIK